MFLRREIEIRRRRLHRGISGPLYFFRTSTGDEVDLVVEHEGRLVPIEIKASETPSPRMTKGIDIFRALFGDRATGGFVIHGGAPTLPLGNDSLAVPFAGL